ncbi:MobF family relaxase [Rothia sp. P4278]|uniref:MobF family relaxase n=1 Tax=Rothia sp. P4278 TaxID=3402658 RepID=UPI003AE725B5
MTVSISRMNIEYYLSTVAVGDSAESRKHLTNYYTASGDPAGRWFGSGLAGIGRSNEQTVTKKDARAVYEDLAHPDTKIPLGKRPMKKTEAPQDAKNASGKTAKKTREAVAGFDLTFSAPKSVSALWAISDSATQTVIHQAHQNAVRTSLLWLENSIIQSRAGDGGIAKVEVEGIIASLFDHYDSRAGDPQIHTHAVLANRVQRKSDGAWVTLDSYALHKWVVATSEMYNAILFDELTELANTETEQRQALKNAMKLDESQSKGNRRIELIGVPDELIAEFSQRSNEIERITNQKIEDWKAKNGDKISKKLILEFRQQATLESRNAKVAQKLPLQSRLYQWRQRARALGLTPDEIVHKATGHHAATYTLETFSTKAIEEIATHVLERTITKHPAFNRANLTASTHRLLGNIRCTNLEERAAITNKIVDTAVAAAVELTPDRYQLDHLTQSGLTLRGTSVFDLSEEKLYTTRAFLNIEADLMRGATTATGAHLSETEKARQVLSEHVSDKGHALAPDQLEAAYQVTTSSRAINAIIGPAGTGKTSTLAGVRAAWEATYGQDSIIGLAPSAAAAEVLAKDLGISTENTAKWLYESVGDGVARRAERYQRINKRITTLEAKQAKDPSSRFIAAALDAERTKLATVIAEQSKYRIRAGQLVIVDEASMSATADLHQLYSQVQAAGGKMLLVGDPKQLDSVDAGGFLGWMENKGHSANLTSVWRFKNDWEKAASLALRQGNTDVIATYREKGRIIGTDSPLDSAYESWLVDTNAGLSSVLIAGTNADVLALNQRAQAERISQGAVDTSKATPIRNDLIAHIGDTILARQNNRQLTDENGNFIKNGTRLTITDIDSTAIIAQREDNSATVHLPKEYAQESIELGYACTIHRSQGLTVDTGHLALDDGYNREQLYVGMTRGRQSNTMHVPTPEEEQDTADNWGIMKKVHAESVEEFVAGIIRKSDVDKTAHEVRDAEYGWSLDLGRSVSELDYVADLAATRRTHQWFEKQFGQDLRAVADTPELKKLIRAVKASDADFADLPAGANIADATAYFRRKKAPSDFSLLSAPRHLTNDEAEASMAITSKIENRLAELKVLHAEDPWFMELQERAPEATEAVLTWRALSHQTDAETSLGQPPKTTERRLSFLYETVLDVVDKAEKYEAEKYRYNDHEQVDTGDNWQQDNNGPDWDNWQQDNNGPDWDNWQPDYGPDSF